MRKIWKALTLVALLSLIVCAVAISSFATETGRVSELTSPWQYTDSSGNVKTAATISEAVSGAKTGSTITLLCDQTIAHDASIVSISKALTVDLGGHTLMISQAYQAYININTTSEVTFKNGTIVASGNSAFGKLGAGYAIFRNAKSGIKLKLENVNTYSACVLLAGWTDNPTLTINGGEHHIVYSEGHMYGGGILETRRKATLNVNDATIYLKSGAAVNGHSYSATATDKSMSFTFTNCKIITSNGSRSIVGYANENTTITFNGCDIYGSINPTVSTDDANNSVKGIKDGAIVLCGGTRFASTADNPLCAQVACKSGEGIIGIADSVDYTLKLSSGSVYYDTATGSLENVSFSTSSEAVSVTYSNFYGVASDLAFSYGSLGKTYYTSELAGAIAKCDSVISLNKDFTVQLTKKLEFTRDVVIDLRGNTLSIVESGDCSLRIADGVTVTVRNGSIIKRNTKGNHSEYPLFSSEVGSVTLNLEDVSVDSSALIAAYDDGSKINISGGTHGSFDASAGYAFAYIDLYAECEVKIDGAIMLVGNLPAFSSMAPNVSIELNDSRVFGNTSGARLMEFIDADNKITVNGCDVFASFDMIGNASEDELRGTIVLGDRTRVAKLDAADGMIAAAFGKAFTKEKISETITYPTADGDYVSKTFTFEYTVGDPFEGAVATYVSGNVTCATDDIKTAFASAGAGTEIILLCDLTLTESMKSFISINTANLTLNLGGYTLEVIQQGEACISIYKNFTIKNGTLRAAMDNTVSASVQGKSYPVLCYGGGAKNISLTLEDVNTYAGSLIFAWDCSGHSLNVIGGKHHAETYGTGCDNGWLDVRGDFKLKAEDATFYINNNSYVVSALSFKDTDKTNLASSFDFTGCKIIAENGKSNAIGYANENCKFSFTDCDIYASINPSLNSNDSGAGYSAIKAGAITLGGGVRLSSVGTFISGGVIVTASGYVMSDITSSVRVVYEGYSFDPDTAKFTENDKILNASYSTSVGRSEDFTVTVKWYKEDGVTLLREDKVTKGTVVTPPSYAPGVSNGWFKTGYSGWSTSFSSTMAATDFTATKNISYYPCVSDAVTADLTVARYNLTLVGKVCNNLYLPVTPAGISIKGVFVNGVEIPKAKVTMDGNKYYMYTVSEVGAARLNTVTTVTVKYIAAGTELSATLSLKPAAYAETILKDSTLASPVYSASAHAVAADLVRYSNALCIAVDGVADSKLASLISTYGSVASELVPSNSFAEYRANTTALKGIIESIALEVSATEPRWVFTVASGAEVSGIEVELEGYLPKVVDGVNFGKIIYKTEVNDGGVYFTEYIPIYNLDRLMTVRVMLERGGYVEGKYSLNAYYNGFSTEDGNAEEIRTFIKAFRTLGKSSSEYKYGKEIKTSSTIVDFFSCDHDNIGAFYEAQGRYCPDCATYVFFYSDFGAVADGVSDRNSNASGTNNHQMMYMCHKAANEWKAAGNKTAVQAVGGAHNGTKYYIGKQYNKSSASIMTDTSWSGAEFIVDDRTVKIADKDGFAIPVFRADVDQKKEWAINYNAYAPANGLASGSRNVGFAPGRPMMLQILDKSRRNNIRQGSNENTGESIHEMILVDEYGNISNDTPVEWDYYNVQFCKYGCTYVDSDSNKKCDTCGTSVSNSMTITGYAIDVDPITVSGLDKDGNINFIWETITDNTVYIEHYTQCGRRFQVARSNVTVMGIDHYFTEDNTNETPRTAYAGVVNVTTCNNVTVRDMLVVQHISHAALDGVGQGSYEFSAGNACNINLIGYRAKNFFGDGGSVPSRGMFGTNYIRNFYVKDCVLTSFDSHSGAYNAVLEDSVFEHVNFVGGGNAYMKNCTVYVDSGRSACVLRQDYGSMWHGNIYFDGLKLRYSKSAVTCIDLVESSYTNWNFGTETYLPEEIIANNVTIERYSRDTADYVAENGTLRENIVGVNEVPLGIHHFLNKQLVSHVDYSTVSNANLDGKHPTKRVEINNCGNIQIAYPDHTFFSNMEVYIDGVKQDWFNKRDSLLCEDFDGDYVCDVCKYEFTCSKSHPASGSAFTKCTGCGNVRYIAPGESAVELKQAYEYTKGGNTITAFSGTSLSDVIANADSGTTIKLLTDNTVDLSGGTYSIVKDITIDLNGKILKVYSNKDVAAYHIGNNKTLTWQNGTVICMVEGTEYTHGRPLTSLGTKSTVNFNNVTAFVSCLAYSYNSDNVTININGGEYYAIAQSDAGQASFIETRANVNFTAQDALFYLTNNSSYYLISGTNNYVDSGDKYNNYTFTNCDIIRNDKGKLVYYANEFTKIYLNDCRVYGTLNNGTHYSEDKNQGTAASKSGMYVIGANTRLLKNKSGWLGSIGAETYIEANATYAEGCSQSDSSKSITYTLKKISGTGDGVTITTQSKSFSFTALVS